MAALEIRNRRRVLRYRNLLVRQARTHENQGERPVDGDRDPRRDSRSRSNYRRNYLLAEFEDLRLADTGFPQLRHEPCWFNRFRQEMDTELNAFRGRDHARDGGQGDRIDPIVSSGFKNDAGFQYRAPSSYAASYMRDYETCHRQLVATKYSSH